MENSNLERVELRLEMGTFEHCYELVPELPFIMKEVPLSCLVKLTSLA